jgi:hypothetical protein
MSVGDFDSPGVADRAKDLGAVLIARRVVPANPADLVVELGREPLDGGRSGPTVDEHELEAFVRTGLGEVLEYQFDSTGFGH